MIRCLLIFNFGFFAICVYAQHISISDSVYKHNPEWAKVTNERELVHHLAYTLEYNESCEQASWVAYILTREKSSGTIERSDHFRSDPMVLSGSADKTDYYKSGFDRGHLAPAADMKWSEQAMDESFYFSNMSPQKPAFNRGIWKKLEEKVRDWALQYDSLLVVTGPILDSSLSLIGPNEVCIPAYFYKAVVVYRGEKSKAIAFILPNKASSLPLSDFVISIDELEARAQLDFFYGLSDSLEVKIESQYCVTCWDW